jgi:hypothetical protein
MTAKILGLQKVVNPPSQSNTYLISIETYSFNDHKTKIVNSVYMILGSMS